MPKSPAAFPRLLRAAAEAGRFSYGSIPVTVSGHAIAQVAAGRRSVSASPSISDHPHRMGEALARMLRDPAVRADLRALLASYEPAEARDPWHVGELPGDDGRTIRDENGLTVCTAPSAEAARLLVEDHNGR